MEVTTILQRLHTGDREALHDLIPLVYDELKRLAGSHLRRESQPGALETTALVHEAFLKMANGRHPLYEDRAHFYGVASRLMRQVLVDAARARTSEKRSAAKEVALTELPDRGGQSGAAVLQLDDALERLHQIDPRNAQLIEMRYFGGMTAEESAEALSAPVHTVRRELRLARAWLQREIAG